MTTPSTTSPTAPPAPSLLDVLQSYAPDAYTPRDERAFGVAWSGAGKWAHLRITRSRDVAGDVLFAFCADKRVGGRFRSLDSALKAVGL